MYKLQRFLSAFQEYFLLFIAFSMLIISCRSSAKLAQPSWEKEINLVPRSGWNALDPKPYNSHVPVRITLHHEGTKFDTARNAAQFIRNVQVWGMGKDRNWADIPYHFLIAPDGTVYEGRNVMTVGETATEYDPTGHLLITCLGNFEVQEIGETQLNALVHITALMSRRYRIDPATIASHRDHSQQTTCPGKNLYRYVQDGTIRNRVMALLRGK